MNTHSAAAAVRAKRFAVDSRRLGAHVVYVRQIFDPAKLTERQRRVAGSDELCTAGSWGAELYLVPEHLVSGQDFGTRQTTRDPGLTALQPARAPCRGRDRDPRALDGDELDPRRPTRVKPAPDRSARGGGGTRSASVVGATRAVTTADAVKSR